MFHGEVCYELKENKEDRLRDQVRVWFQIYIKDQERLHWEKDIREQVRSISGGRQRESKMQRAWNDNCKSKEEVLKSWVRLSKRNHSAGNRRWGSRGMAGQKSKKAYTTKNQKSIKRTKLEFLIRKHNC